MCCGPSPAAARRRWAATSINVPNAVIRPSLIIPAGTGTARSVRRKLANAGSPHERRELLDVPYFHVVFTLPHELNPLCLRNARVLYDLLFRASAATMLEVAANPKRLGAQIGFISILHTWGQNLLFILMSTAWCRLADSRRRPRAMGSPEVRFLLAGERAQFRLSSQVR